MAKASGQRKSQKWNSPYKEDEGRLNCKENIRRKSEWVKRKAENGVGVDEIAKKRKMRSLKEKKLCL